MILGAERRSGHDDKRPRSGRKQAATECHEARGASRAPRASPEAAGSQGRIQEGVPAVPEPKSLAAAPKASNPAAEAKTSEDPPNTAAIRYAAPPAANARVLAA